MNELPSVFSSMGMILILAFVGITLGRLIANRMSKK
jgi:hypothetical protein